METVKPAITLRLTDAPEVYDGFGTRTIETVGTSNRIGATGNPVRLVSIDPAHDEWQTTRYDSGTYMYTSQRVKIGMMLAFNDWTIDGPTLERLATLGIEGIEAPPTDG